jgi:hypothetical protein
MLSGPSKVEPKSDLTQTQLSDVIEAQFHSVGHDEVSKESVQSTQVPSRRPEP